MSELRKALIDKVLAERDRQFNLPGSEWDHTNKPNDWIAIAASYLLRGSCRNHLAPLADSFEDDLVKAAAVILAALEHAELMKTSGTLQ
jgi:hypothetical protein